MRVTFPQSAAPSLEPISPDIRSVGISSGDPNHMRSLIRTTLALLTACAAVSQGQDSLDPEYQSYLAHISAANASLRLHETAEAKRWLAPAPAKHRGGEWHMLSRRADQSLAALAPEGLSPRGLHLRADGKMLAAVIDDTVIVLIDTRTHKIVRKITGHSSTIYAVRFSPDGTRLVTCSRDTTVRVWDLATGALLFELKRHTQPVPAITFSADGEQIVTGGTDGMLMVWDAFTGRFWRCGVCGLLVLLRANEQPHSPEQSHMTDPT